MSILQKKTTLFTVAALLVVWSLLLSGVQSCGKVAYNHYYTPDSATGSGVLCKYTTHVCVGACAKRTVRNYPHAVDSSKGVRDHDSIDISKCCKAEGLEYKNRATVNYANCPQDEVGKVWHIEEPTTCYCEDQ